MHRSYNIVDFAKLRAARLLHTVERMTKQSICDDCRDAMSCVIKGYCLQSRLKDDIMADLSYNDLIDNTEIDSAQGAILDDPFADAAEVPDMGTAVEDMELDGDVLARQEQEAFLPQGIYKWHEGKCTITEKFNAEDKSSIDLKPTQGRYIITVQGVAASTDPKGRKSRFFFSMSPDDRYFKDENGKALEEKDGFSKNWVSLLNFFLKREERKPKSTGDVKAFLLKAMYYMYITQSKKNGQNYLGSFREIA